MDPSPGSPAGTSHTEHRGPQFKVGDKIVSTIYSDFYSHPDGNPRVVTVEEVSWLENWSTFAYQAGGIDMYDGFVRLATAEEVRVSKELYDLEGRATGQDGPDEGMEPALMDGRAARAAAQPSPLDMLLAAEVEGSSGQEVSAKEQESGASRHQTTSRPTTIADGASLLCLPPRLHQSLPSLQVAPAQPLKPSRTLLHSEHLHSEYHALDQLTEPLLSTQPLRSTTAAPFCRPADVGPPCSSETTNAADRARAAQPSQLGIPLAAAAEVEGSSGGEVSAKGKESESMNAVDPASGTQTRPLPKFALGERVQWLYPWKDFNPHVVTGTVKAWWPIKHFDADQVDLYRYITSTGDFLSESELSRAENVSENELVDGPHYCEADLSDHMDLEGTNDFDDSTDHRTPKVPVTTSPPEFSEEWERDLFQNLPLPPNWPLTDLEASETDALASQVPNTTSTPEFPGDDGQALFQDQTLSPDWPPTDLEMSEFDALVQSPAIRHQENTDSHAVLPRSPNWPLTDLDVSEINALAPFPVGQDPENAGGPAALLESTTSSEPRVLSKQDEDMASWLFDLCHSIPESSAEVRDSEAMELEQVMDWVPDGSIYFDDFPVSVGPSESASVLAGNQELNSPQLFSPSWFLTPTFNPAPATLQPGSSSATIEVFTKPTTPQSPDPTAFTSAPPPFRTPKFQPGAIVGLLPESEHYKHNRRARISSFEWKHCGNTFQYIMDSGFIELEEKLYPSTQKAPFDYCGEPRYIPGDSVKFRDSQRETYVVVKGVFDGDTGYAYLLDEGRWAYEFELIWEESWKSEEESKVRLAELEARDALMERLLRNAEVGV